jgi:hypothetical protein
MPTNPVVYEDKGASATGGALFDMLTSQNKAQFQHGLDMEKQAKANEFTTTLETLRSTNQGQREAEAFERNKALQMLSGQQLGTYTGGQAVAEAGKGNVYAPLVTQHADEDVERAMGHPLFTAKPIEPLAAEAAHRDLQSFLGGRQKTEEAVTLAKAKIEADSIGPEEVTSAQTIAAELDAAGLTPLAAAFRGLRPGAVSRKEYFEGATKASIELVKAKTRIDVSKTFAQARIEASKIGAEARKYAADAAAKSRIDRKDADALTKYQTGLNQQMTKLQNAERIARDAAKEAYGDERYIHLKEADRHNSAFLDAQQAHEQVTNQLGRVARQPVVDEKQFKSEEIVRAQIVDELGKAGKIAKRKTWAELNAKDQAIVQAEHVRRFNARKEQR